MPRGKGGLELDFPHRGLTMYMYEVIHIEESSRIWGTMQWRLVALVLEVEESMQG